MVSLVLRIWILDKRWINPDEGAHLASVVDFDKVHPALPVTST